MVILPDGKLIFFNNKIYMNTGSGINSFENIRTAIVTDNGINVRINLLFPYSNYIYICCFFIPSGDSHVQGSALNMLIDLNHTTNYNSASLCSMGTQVGVNVSITSLSNTQLNTMLYYYEDNKFKYNGKGIIIYQYFT